MSGTKVIELKWLPVYRWVAAITLFGVVFTRDRSRIDRYVLNHERIHCRQQREWLYIPFFILYGIEYLINLIRYRNAKRAYRAISFEREAYSHESDLTYLSHRLPYANYRGVLMQG